jgi:hypothetical protein
MPPTGRKAKSERARLHPFRAIPEFSALLERRRINIDAAQRAGERIIPHVFYDAAGCSLFGADQRPKKNFRRAWRVPSRWSWCYYVKYILTL